MNGTLEHSELRLPCTNTRSAKISTMRVAGKSATPSIRSMVPTKAIWTPQWDVIEPTEFK